MLAARGALHRTFAVVTLPPLDARQDPGRGRVRGTEGLVVGDASLMPSIPTSNIHLPTLMIGERIGEWLRDGAYD